MAGLIVVPPFLAAASPAERLSRPSTGHDGRDFSQSRSRWLSPTSAPAYTYDQPLRRQARVLQEEGASKSLWQVGSLEPGLDLDDGAPGIWTPAADRQVDERSLGQRCANLSSSRIPRPATRPCLRRRYLVARRCATSLAASNCPSPSSHASPAVRLVRPARKASTPARSNLPGIVRSGRWTATYVAPPPEGIAFRASFTGVTAERLRETRVAVTSRGVPGGEGWQRLPPWLPQDRMVWTVRATWVRPASAAAALSRSRRYAKLRNRYG